MNGKVRVGERLRLDIEEGSELEARFREIKAALGLKSDAEVLRFLIMNFPLELYKQFPLQFLRLVHSVRETLEEADA